MPSIGNFQINRGVDGTVTIVMSPPVAIGGWPLQAVITKRMESSTEIITGYANSGYNGVSGILVTNSGAGMFNFSIPATITSGLDPGNYALNVWRLTSGQRTLIQQGYMELTT